MPDNEMSDAERLATSRGFTYWPGGESAPSDWDGGSVLFRDGYDNPFGAWEWTHERDPADIIGYHRKPEEPSSPSKDLVTTTEEVLAQIGIIIDKSQDEMKAAVSVFHDALKASTVSPSMKRIVTAVFLGKLLEMQQALVQ